MLNRCFLVFLCFLRLQPKPVRRSRLFFPSLAAILMNRLMRYDVRLNLVITIEDEPMADAGAAAALVPGARRGGDVR